MAYSKELLRHIFQNKFDREAWKAIVKGIFQANVRNTPEIFSTPNDAEEGYYFGFGETADRFRIGYFYYKIKIGSVAHKKVGLRNLVKSFLNQTSGEFDAALVVFDDGKEWRLSFVCDIKEEATSPKRFTYVFGEHDNFYRTPIDRFDWLQGQKPTFANIRKAFSVDSLSDDFFDTYRDLYADFVQYITGKRYVKEGNKCVERKLGAANYQFENTFEGNDKLVRDYVKKMFGRIVFLYFLQRKGWLDGNRQYMHDLFYNSTKKDDFLDSVLEPLFFEVLNTDKPYRTEAAKSLPGSENIPYLNGGLFARDEIDERNCIFKEEDFERLFDFLDSYNFTIDENDTEDAEIGIDPEMLGRIFENLLEDNKDKGAFYTPKEIVDYMCRESLISYLKTHKEDKVNDHEIQQLVENFDGENLSLDQRKHIKDKLKQIKICDPAIGSGAFPMGLVNLLSKIYGVLKLSTDMGTIKRHIMEQNIYGVDIEQGAVDIARLRFWLAMIVEEKDPIPLPNLHFKIMQGNSLLESYKGIDLSDLTDSEIKIDKKGQFQMDFGNNNDRLELSSLLRLYYNTSRHDERDTIFKAIIDNVNQQIKEKGITLPAGLAPSANTDFFLWHTWFADVFANGGFDIVIGNPPYISAPAQVAHPILNEQRNRIIKSKKYDTLYLKWDLYIAFVELGIKLLNNHGIEAMIIPYPFTNQGYAMKCRDFIINKNSLIEISDLSEVKVFKNATVQNCIIFVEKNNTDKEIKISRSIQNEDTSISLKTKLTKNKEAIIQNSKGVWNLVESPETDILHPDLNVFGDFCYISVGMVLNSDEKSAQGAFKKDDLISLAKDDIHSRLYVEAKDIIPYGIKRHRFLEWDTKRCPGELRRPTFRELYEVQKLLINRLGKLQSTIDLENHYLHSDSLFCAVPWINLKGINNKSISGSIKKFASLKREEMEKLSERVSLKYLCAILNSKYSEVLLKEQRGGDYHIYPDHIRNIPIPIADSKTQERICLLVDSIIELSDKNSDGANAILKEIDLLVYVSYGLSYDEIISYDPNTLISREEYERYSNEFNG